MTAYNANPDIDIFVPAHSRGLMIDALILQSCIKGNSIRIITFPLECARSLKEVNESRMVFEPLGQIAIFIERVFEHRKLYAYKKRILLPNPEWLFEQDLPRIERVITDVWHKTKFSKERLPLLLPLKRHTYVGFTSTSRGERRLNYNSLFHVSGVNSEFRHTQELVDLWLNNKAFPQLTVRANWNGSLKIPVWISHLNLRIFMGDMLEAEFEKEFITHGVHVCTSQMEGFGHYINEARSIGALVVALDAPPMNELICSNTGILVSNDKAIPHGGGMRYIASAQSISLAMQQLMLMTESRKESMGKAAKERYLEERQEFIKTINTEF